MAERAKVAKHVMISTGVYRKRKTGKGKGRLHFIPDKSKINAKLYVELLFHLLKTASLFYRLVSFSSS